MPKYKSKPLIVEAFRLGYEKPPEWFITGISPNDAELLYMEPKTGLTLNVRGGSVWVAPGDYICKDHFGRVYSMSASMFTRTHDAI